MTLDLAMISQIWHEKHKQQQQKKKKKKIGLRQNQKLLRIKGRYEESEKTTHRMGKNLCKS